MLATKKEEAREVHTIELLSAVHAVHAADAGQPSSPVRHMQGSAAIGYAPSVHDVCRQISQANLLRNTAGIRRVNGRAV
jgi:hypothetical protein